MWSDPSRLKKNLQYIVNNARFLILPWVTCKNLASKILSLTSHRLSRDWQDRYGYQPVLLETFVERGRFAGTCYKAANWLLVGQTKGRGKLGPAGKISVPIKDLWLYPLERNFRQILTSWFYIRRGTRIFTPNQSLNLTGKTMSIFVKFSIGSKVIGPAG